MDVKELKKKAVEVRKGAITLTYRSKGHIGGTMSSADILTAIYYHFLRFDPQDPENPDRDRFILSKGHTCEGYLWILADCGYYDKAQLEQFNQFDSLYISHPSGRINGVEFSTGALGHGLALACGVALGGKKAGKNYDCYVLMGDGETDEGSVWEAAMFAGANHLDNLYAIVDRNYYQITENTEQVMPLEPYAEKWRAFGFEVEEIDGNNMEEILAVFEKLHGRSGKPKLIISKTLKGKGVSFMEGNKKWHHGTLTKEQYETAMEELDREMEVLGK